MTSPQKIRKLITSLTVALILTAIGAGVDAQMMMRDKETVGSSAVKDDHTAREEAEGKEIWEKLRANQTKCADLKDENFAALGEYLMGLMMGDSHAAMNQMMTSMMGEKGEEQMHVAMGKRLSGCDTSAALPAGGYGFMPMMQMIGGGFGPTSMMGTPPYSSEKSGVTGFASAFGWIALASFFLWWLLVFAAIFAVIRWIAKRFKGGSAIETLKERYAKGEIPREEFEEKKKDLS